MDPILIMGPTAVGKSAVALELAAALNGEIVSADSMQVYRGMDIGTAKPSAAEQVAIPHHLIDVCAVTQTFDVKQFTTRAVAAVAEVRANQHTPLIVGGSGLYLRALRHGIFDGPPRNPSLRAKLELMSAATLFAELERVDPETAATIDRSNPRRLVRALEVFQATGRPITQQQAEWPTSGLPEAVNGLSEGSLTDGEGAPADFARCPAFCLDRDRADLHHRIEQRIDEQLQAGWLEEVQRLLVELREHGSAPATAAERTALQAAGYRELAAYLEQGGDWAATVTTIKARTRQLARRQITWFRRETAVTWIQIEPDESPARTAQRILATLPKGTPD